MFKSRYQRVHTPIVIQMEAVECGAASLAMILGYHGKYVPLEEVRLECGVSRDGSNAFNIMEAAEKYGLNAEAYETPAEEICDVELPIIVFWEFNHFLVVEGFGKNKVYLNDPAQGPRFVTNLEFEHSYSGMIISFTKKENFVKGGKSESLIKLIVERLKTAPKALVFLFLTDFCLLIPKFAFPAFLTIFINAFFRSDALPWKWEFLGMVLLSVAFLTALTKIQLYFLAKLNTKLSMQFSSDFFWHLLKLPMNFYSQRNGGEIAYRMHLNNTVAQNLTGSVISAILNFILILFFGAALFFYDTAIASISIIIGLLNLMVMYYVIRSRVIAYACLQQNIAKSVGQSIGGMQNIETIKSKGIESDFFSRWAGYYTRNINSSQQIEKKDAFLITLPIFFQSTALAALLGIGALRIIEGSLSIGTLMALQILQINFLLPINRFVGLSSLLQSMKKDIQRLNDVMKNEVDVIYDQRHSKIQKEEKKRFNSETAVEDGKLTQSFDPESLKAKDPFTNRECESLALNDSESKPWRTLPSRTAVSRLKGELEFRNVCFKYSPLSPCVINNLSFTIKPGQKVAIIGPSGSGKTTIGRLATALYYPSSGQIFFDGAPIEEISIELFRNSVSSIDQDIFLFSGTIRENLTFWNNKIPNQILINAAIDANIHDEISMRNGGYDSLLTEEGRNLSGGQRQRIEIARALLYYPSLLIMDEATSALDDKTERAVMGKIKEREISALIIANRLSTIKNCDEILVLDQGSIIQRGSHEELMKNSEIYQEFVKADAYA